MAERAASPTAGRTRRAVALPNAPAMVCGPDGVLVQANLFAAELVGVGSPDELVDLRLDELLVHGDNVLRRLDGVQKPVRAVRWPIQLTGEQLVVLIDLSDIIGPAEAAFQALADERRRLDKVQRVARMGSWEYDPATGETVWSATHYELLGLEPGSVRPGSEAVLAAVHPDDKERVAAFWQEHKVTGEPLELEYRIIRPDGEVRVMLGVGEAQCGEFGGVQRITGYMRDVTASAQVRAELAEERAKLAEERAKLIEAQRIAKIGSWNIELKTGIVHRSEVLNEMYAENGVVPDNDMLCNIHPDDRAKAEKMRSAMLHADAEQVVEAEFRSERGGRIYLTRSRVELGPDGKAARVHGTLQDVTEQRTLQRRLAEAQRAAQVGIWEWDPATGECFWSDMLYELSGVPADKPVSYYSIERSVHPDDHDWVVEHFRKAAVEHSPVDCEFRTVLADGSLRIFRCRGGMIDGPDGRRIIAGTAQDVTQQRVTETRMRRSSQRFIDLVAVSPVGIGLFDESERLVDANNALCELLGVELEQLRGRTVEEFTHPEQRQRLSRFAAGIAEGRGHGARVIERTLLRADGRPVCCELHIAISVRDDGQRFWLVVFTDVTEQRKAAEALRYQATHDELTRLPNRAAVNELLANLLRTNPDAPGDHVYNIAVLFCDIDNFKRVNDSLGHDAGDELLIALARRLEDGLPDSCTVARLSGDEYVIICSDVGAVGGVDELATVVSSLLRNAVPVRGQLVRVSASIGVAVPSSIPAVGADLLRFADAAMFEAKERGPGRVALASAALIASADRQVHLEGQLRDALARDELVLHFQPVVDPEGKVLTAEALVRWPHPDRGLLGPDVFLPVAEQGALLRELDRWVLRTALRQAAQWPRCGSREVAVAVNLTGLVPDDDGFVDVVADAVAEAGIAWDRVVLELVETSLVDLPSRSRMAMASLTERGVRFAVDDFGTGYSSLARLKDLPAQIIKIDRRFIAGVGTDPSDLAVARAVVDMARAMGRSCVAEGVETPTQFNVLRGVGVDAYQGWLFSRAVPPEEFCTMLERGELQVPQSS